MGNFTRAVGKENEPVSPVKSLQTTRAAAHPYGSASKPHQSAADMACKDFSFRTVAEKNVTSPHNSAPVAAPVSAKHLSANKQNKPAEVAASEPGYHTPQPTRPAPRSAFNRQPLQSASNFAAKPPIPAPASFFQQPIPGSPGNAHLPQYFQASLSPLHAQPCLPYNSFQLPVMPMYPPYTPHPGHFDPSGRFSNAPSQFGWENQPVWLPTTPSTDSTASYMPATPQTCYSPYAQSSEWTEHETWVPPAETGWSPNTGPAHEVAWQPQNAAFLPQPQLAFWPPMMVWQPELEPAFAPHDSPATVPDSPPAADWHKSEGIQPQDSFWSGQSGMADKATTWRRQEEVPAVVNPGFELSMRQMTSMCFQASSKGSYAELPRAAVKALVEHQIRNSQPLHAPWYRSQSSKRLTRSSIGTSAREENMAGTGVWIPGEAQI